MFETDGSKAEVNKITVPSGGASNVLAVTGLVVVQPPKVQAVTVYS